jgi:glucosamine-6-phosphate deaminase
MSSVLIYRDPNTAGVCAATLIASHLLTDSGCVIGVDYHETLLPVFDSLSAMTENGLLDWGEAKIFQLFEFLPDEAGEQRIANLLGKALFAKTDISEKQYVVPFSKELSKEETANAFENSILDAGGLDVALIAVRRDGSLFMNRSYDCKPETHDEMIDGDGFITAGLSALMHAKHLIVVGTGRNAAEAVKSMLHGTLSDSPLAALRLHPAVTFVLDDEAAEML